MKKYLLLLSLLLLTVPAMAEERAVTAGSRIERVTVYPDRAMVTRVASVQLKPGPYKVVFPGLPGEAGEDSIRVSGRGALKARIGTVETKRVFLEASGKERERKLQEEILGLRDQDKALADEQAIMSRQKDFYQAIQFHNAEVWSKEITIGRLTVEDWAKVVDFLERGQKHAAGKAQSLDVRRRALKEKIDALERELADIRSRSPGVRLQASVEVESPGEGVLDLELGYVVMGASWGPLYEARADTDSGKVEVTYQGQVTQKTSEDWNSVELSLSTAKPAVGASPPRLLPWYIRTVQPQVFKAEQEMMNIGAYRGQMEKDEGMAPVGGEAPQAPAEVMTAQAVAAGTSVQFKAMTRQDVPADGSAHKVTIAVDTLDAAFEYFTVPKLAPYAYLKGFLTNGREYPFLQGQASVFLGEDYLGRSFVPLTAPGEKFELALGIDEGVKVKRELVRRQEEDTGIINKTRRITYAYKITVESYKKAAQKITVLDQLPVSQQEEVVVKEVRIDPQPTERDEKGFLKWKLEVAPKEKKEIYMEFYVEFPRDRLVGGI